MLYFYYRNDESLYFFAKSILIIHSKKYSIRTNIYAKNSIGYWCESRIYTLLTEML